jgi:hypothetical protein
LLEGVIDEPPFLLQFSLNTLNLPIAFFGILLLSFCDMPFYLRFEPFVLLAVLIPYLQFFMILLIDFFLLEAQPLVLLVTAGDD